MATSIPPVNPLGNPLQPNLVLPNPNPANATPAPALPGKPHVELIVEHYQKTYELVYDLVNKRNNLFITLVGFLAVWTFLLSLGQQQAVSLLVVWVAKTIGQTDPDSIRQLQSNLNFDLLQTLALAVVFYLTVNVYRNTQDVIRLYAYLGKLEGEIRQDMGLSTPSIAFTRESSFYWGQRPPAMAWIGRIYIIILALLLGGFIVIRLFEDWQTPLSAFKIALNLADIILSVAILIFFVSYARASAQS